MKCGKKLSALVACLCLFFACGLFGTDRVYAATMTPTLNSLSFEEQANLGSWSRWQAGTAYPVNYYMLNLPTTSVNQYAIRDIQASFQVPTETGVSFKIKAHISFFSQESQINMTTCQGLTAVLEPFGAATSSIWTNITSCNITAQGPNTQYMDITIESAGTFSQATQVNTIFWDVQNYSNFLVSCSNYSGGNACGSIRYGFTFYDVDFEMGQDPNTGILNEQLQIQQQQQQQDQQDRNNIEQGQQDAEQQGETAGAAASATGQTLMQAFTSLVTALTGIHQTNCNLPNFNIYGLNFTNMNMCMFDVPNGLMSLASIGMVFIIVPLGINLVKRMIALYNEIVGGGK